MDLDRILENFEKAEDEHRDDVGSEPVLFVHDSCVRKQGEVFAFHDNDYGILRSLLEKSKIPTRDTQFIAAIKQIGISEKDATTEMIHENRPLLEEDIIKAKPKLIFVLGNLAMKTLLRKSGIANKRGKEFWISIDEEDIPVVPLYHPFSIYSEPKLRGLFVQDLNNSYDKFVLDKNKLAASSYKLHNEVTEAVKAIKRVSSHDAVAIDLETTGLDFKKDVITTIGFAVGEKDAFVVPINHRESELSEKDLNSVKDSVRELFEDKNVAKVLHNCKFDLKFLANWGVEVFYNIHDTQIMHSLVNENLPHGLMELVKQYFPHELESF